MMMLLDHYVKFPKIIGYVKCFDDNKTISFKVIDNKPVKRYIKILQKNYNLIDKEFDSKPVSGDNDKFIKTKIKLYEKKVNRNFQGKEIPKENVSHNCLSLIMLESVIRVNKTYYAQTLLEECKYIIKKN